MNVSTAEWLALAIFSVSFTKSVWDFVIAPAWFRRLSRGKSREALTAEVRRKRDRDANAHRAAFALLTLLSAIVLWIGFTGKEVTPDDLQALAKKLQALESRLSQQPTGCGNP